MKKQIKLAIILSFTIISTASNSYPFNSNSTSNYIVSLENLSKKEIKKKINKINSLSEEVIYLLNKRYSLTEDKVSIFQNHFLNIQSSLNYFKKEINEKIDIDEILFREQSIKLVQDFVNYTINLNDFIYSVHNYVLNKSFSYTSAMGV